MFGQISKPAIPQLRPADLRPREPARVAVTAIDAAAEADATESGSEPLPFAPRREEKRLIVGKGIVLKVEVSACDRLVVEGSIEASLTDSDVVVIAEGGEYKGSAHINEADIAGTFEGTLTAQNRLIVRASGHIIGEIRYGELEVERGGKMSGDIQNVAESESGDGNVKASQGDLSASLLRRAFDNALGQEAGDGTGPLTDDTVEGERTTV